MPSDEPCLTPHTYEVTTNVDFPQWDGMVKLLGGVPKERLVAQCYHSHHTPQEALECAFDMIRLLQLFHTYEKNTLRETRKKKWWE